MDKQKKQMLMMGVLLLVLVAVGAFQFMGPKPAPVATTDASNEDGTPATTEVTGGSSDGSNASEGEVVAKGTEPVVNPEVEPLVQNQLPPRDPFMPTKEAEHAAQENADLANKTAAPVGQVAQATPPPQSYGGQRLGATNIGAFNPLPNIDPNQQIGLPSVGGAGNPPQNLEPAKRTGYKVVGTIVGKHKMVVLEDPDGNQVLVPEGGKTPDKKARVVSVGSGKAKVSQEGQVKMLGLEEE